jgi:hypothetical protein
MREHPAEDSLMRHSVGELPAAAADEVRAHVAACADCQRVLASLEAERTALLARTPATSLVAALERRHFARRRRTVARWSAALTGVAAAAALLLFLRTPPPRIGVKGGGLAVYVKRGERVRLLGATDAVRPGDALRLVVTLDRQRLVRAWSIDDAGRVDALSAAPQKVGPGTSELDGSAVIEQPCVSGWLVVAVGEAARRTPHGQDRNDLLTTLSDGGFTQRITCESR